MQLAVSQLAGSPLAHFVTGSPATASALPANRELNRYNNIVAYDHSRVKVKKTEVCATSNEPRACLRTIVIPNALRFCLALPPCASTDGHAMAVTPSLVPSL